MLDYSGIDCPELVGAEPFYKTVLIIKKFKYDIKTRVHEA